MYSIIDLKKYYTEPGFELKSYRSIIKYDHLIDPNAFTAEKVKEELPNSYITNLCNHPTFTREAEKKLFSKYNYLKYLCARYKSEKTKNKYINMAVEVRNILAAHNMRLAVVISKKSAIKYSLDLDEVVSDAQLWLFRCIDHFNPFLGYKFSTYYVNAIMMNTIKSRVKEHRQKNLSAKAAEILVNQNATTPSVRYNDSDFSRLALFHNSVLNDTHLFDLQDDISILMRAVYASLNEKERYVIFHRYGINCERKKLIEIGLDLRITKERVRQIQVLAEAKIKKAIGDKSHATL